MFTRTLAQRVVQEPRGDCQCVANEPQVGRDTPTIDKPTNGELMSKVDSLDLSQILLYLVYMKDWAQDRAENAIKWYRRFLYLCLIEPNSGLSPTADVDEVWHRHILTMKQYEDDCQMLKGGMIYHQPTFIGDDGGYVHEASDETSFSFEELSSIHFGEVPETTYGFCNSGCNMPSGETPKQVEAKTCGEGCGWCKSK